MVATGEIISTAGISAGRDTLSLLSCKLAAISSNKSGRGTAGNYSGMITEEDSASLGSYVLVDGAVS